MCAYEGKTLSNIVWIKNIDLCVHVARIITAVKERALKKIERETLNCQSFPYFPNCEGNFYSRYEFLNVSLALEKNVLQTDSEKSSPANS